MLLLVVACKAFVVAARCWLSGLLIKIWPPGTVNFIIVGVLLLRGLFPFEVRSRGVSGAIVCFLVFQYRGKKNTRLQDSYPIVVARCRL